MIHTTPIAVGCSGWSYRDWEGPIYPAGTRDKLRYMAERVDVLEINSTYYRPPDPMSAVSWLRRTIDLPDFTFTAKLHQDVTHKHHIDPEMTAHFRRAFIPLIEAGRLPHFLAQFSSAFRDEPARRDHLQRVTDAYASMTGLTLELRHNSWQAPDALRFLDSLGVTVANLDYPAGRDGFNLTRTNIGRHAYLRLHGRNRAAWTSRDPAAGGRYDYHYQATEIEAIVERARQLAENAHSLTIVANNHAHGNAVVNARQIKELLATPETS